MTSIGIKYDVTLMEYCFKDKFFEPFHLYCFMRSISHKTAGYVLNPHLIDEFAEAAGYSERKIKTMMRLLKRRGWILKLGKTWHVSSIIRLKNQIMTVRPDLSSPDAVRLSVEEIKINKTVFKANCVEYFKAKVIKSRYYYELKNGLLDLEKSAFSQADNSYRRERRFGDCSFRLTSQYLGLSISHLWYLSKIQRGPSGGTLSTYYKRYCPEFDEANITSLDDIKAHVEAANEYGENLHEAMFEYSRVMVINPFSEKKIYKVIKRYRKRLSDFIATGVEITKRRCNSKDKGKTIGGLYRLIPNTKSGVNDLNRIIDFYNTGLCLSKTG